MELDPLDFPIGEGTILSLPVGSLANNRMRDPCVRYHTKSCSINVIFEALRLLAGLSGMPLEKGKRLLWTGRMIVG